MIDPHSSPPQTPAPFVGAGPQVYALAAVLALAMGLPLLYIYFSAPEQAPAWGHAISRRAFLLSRPELEVTVFTLIFGLMMVGLGLAGLYHLWRNMSGNAPEA